MFRKKTALVLLVAMVIASALPGCGNKAQEPALPTDSVVDSQVSTATETTAPASGQDASSAAPADSSAESVPELVPVEFERGYIEGQDYISPALQFRLSLGEGFQFYNEAMLASLNTSVSNMSDNSAVGDALDAGAIIIDMAAASLDSSLTANVTYESSAHFVGEGLTSVKDFAEKSVDSIRQSMESMGASNIKISAAPADIEGIDSYGINITCDINGMHFYEKLVLIEKDGILGTVTVSGLSEENVDGVIKGISKL